MSFYRNFNSKEDIIKKWIDNTKDYFTKLFNHLEKYKEYAIFLYKANLTHLLKNEFESRILQIYEKEFGCYKFYFLAGGIFNVYYWLMNDCKESPDTIANKKISFMQK